MAEWEKKQSLGFTTILTTTFSVLENILQKELESLENKARLLQQLQNMKEEID